MIDDFKEIIWQLAQPVVASEGMELIHIECLKMQSRWVFRLFLDKEGGVKIDDCANVSNQLGDILDIHDLTKGSYTLEVSSPGLDRPISRDQDFTKFIGSKVRIKTNIKIEGIKNIQGKLLAFLTENDQRIVLIEVSGKTLRIRKGEIVKTNLVEVG